MSVAQRKQLPVASKSSSFSFRQPQAQLLQCEAIATGIIKELQRIANQSVRSSVTLRVDLATAFGCPFSGNITTTAFCVWLIKLPPAASKK